MADRSTVEILREARERISDPERWAQRYYAFDDRGTQVEANDTAACKWCAVGAVLREMDSDLAGDVSTNPVIGCLRSACFEPDGVAAFNDESEHSDVLALFDRAIKRAEEATS